MTKIFFCYRRDDSTHQAGRLFDVLTNEFGAGNLFKDVDSVPYGRDFRRILAEHVSSCQVLLAIIGDQWLDIRNKSGTRRLDDPSDFVRIEIETALQREIAVIPVLVGKAGLPTEDQLPSSIKRLAFQHGLAIRPDPDFRRDVDQLIQAIFDIFSGAADDVRNDPLKDLQIPRPPKPPSRAPARSAPLPPPMRSPGMFPQPSSTPSQPYSGVPEGSVPFSGAPLYSNPVSPPDTFRHGDRPAEYGQPGYGQPGYGQSNPYPATPLQPTPLQPTPLQQAPFQQAPFQPTPFQPNSPYVAPGYASPNFSPSGYPSPNYGTPSYASSVEQGKRPRSMVESVRVGILKSGDRSISGPILDGFEKELQHICRTWDIQVDFSEESLDDEKHDRWGADIKRLMSRSRTGFDYLISVGPYAAMALKGNLRDQFGQIPTLLLGCTHPRAYGFIESEHQRFESSQVTAIRYGAGWDAMASLMGRKLFPGRPLIFLQRKGFWQDSIASYDLFGSSLIESGQLRMIEVDPKMDPSLLRDESAVYFSGDTLLQTNITRDYCGDRSRITVSYREHDVQDGLSVASIGCDQLSMGRQAAKLVWDHVEAPKHDKPNWGQLPIASPPLVYWLNRKLGFRWEIHFSQEALAGAKQVYD